MDVGFRGIDLGESVGRVTEGPVTAPVGPAPPLGLKTGLPVPTPLFCVLLQVHSRRNRPSLDLTSQHRYRKVETCPGGTLGY